MKDIDDILREDACAPQPDDGFTRRVMAALPPARRRTRVWVRPALVIGSAALGGLLAIVLAPAGFEPMQGFFDLANLRRATPAALTAIAIGVTLFASALVLAAAD